MQYLFSILNKKHINFTTKHILYIIRFYFSQREYCIERNRYGFRENILISVSIYDIETMMTSHLTSSSVVSTSVLGNFPWGQFGKFFSYLCRGWGLPPTLVRRSPSFINELFVLSVRLFNEVFDREVLVDASGFSSFFNASIKNVEFGLFFRRCTKIARVLINFNTKTF